MMVDRLLWTPVRFLVAVIFSLSLPTAILLLGYVYRRQRRQAIKIWTGSPYIAPHWLTSEASATGVPDRRLAAFRDNLKLGLMSSVSVGLLVAPACTLMAFSWYAGWNNSFNKGYEYAAAGPLLGISGVLLGMATMAYLPLAQARQAVTLDWRTIYDWNTNLSILCERPLATFGLPVVGTGVALVLFAARGLPVFANNVPAFTSIDVNPAGFLWRWMFCFGLIFIPMYWWFKGIAARQYARSLAGALTGGRISLDQLHDEEKSVLANRFPAPAVTARGRFRAVLTVLVFSLAWFPAFALLYVQQFLNNLGTWGWLNYPIMWIPMLGYSAS
jgi:hypothetical protein